MSKLILFQGDSITDAGRNFTDDHLTGYGFPTMVKGQLGLEQPGKYTFLNRGISGDRIVDLYARIKLDIINLKPDYMSILIGVNDVWHEIAQRNGVDADKYEKIYNMLIEEVLEQLPNVKIMILEPFILEASATTASKNSPHRWEIFSTEIRKRSEAAQRVAEKFHLPFVPLQNKFDECAKLAEASYWLQDGVHPTAMGHALIAREWMKAFHELEMK